MAATVTEIVSASAFAKNDSLRAAGQRMEEFSIVLTTPTTAGTVTTSKITFPAAYEVWNITDAAVVASPTVTVTPLGSGTSTLAFTGLTTDKSYLVRIRGTR